MDKTEAKGIITQQLKEFSTRSHDELVKLIDNGPITYELESKSKKKYQIEIQAFWDDQPDGDIRVIGSVDDGGLRAFFPLTDSLICTRKTY